MPASRESSRDRSSSPSFLMGFPPAILLFEIGVIPGDALADFFFQIWRHALIFTRDCAGKLLPSEFLQNLPKFTGALAEWDDLGAGADFAHFHHVHGEKTPL